jgi:hypothetical protein
MRKSLYGVIRLFFTMFLMLGIALGYSKNILAIPIDLTQCPEITS